MTCSKWLAAGVAAAIAAPGMGDDPAAPATPAQDATRIAGVVSPAENDARILRWVKIDCDALQSCGKAAVSQSANSEVRAFAQRMVDDHQKWHDSFKAKFGERISAYPPGRQTTNSTPADPNRTGVVVKDDGTSRDGRLAYAPVDFVAVKKKVCDRMKTLGEREMGKLKGEEFDRAFLAHVVMGHEAALAGIDEVRGSASAELATALNEAKEGLANHLKMAQDLCKARKTADAGR